MPRHNRRDVGSSPVAGGGRSFSEPAVEWRGVDYAVRAVTVAAKAYRCPGCDQEIRAGLAHLVTWPLDEAGADSRRHWHRACWDARDTRAPGVLRGRAAPKH